MVMIPTIHTERVKVPVDKDVLLVVASMVETLGSTTTRIHRAVSNATYVRARAPACDIDVIASHRCDTSATCL